VRTFWKRAPFVDKRAWFCAARVFFVFGKVVSGELKAALFSGHVFPRDGAALCARSGNMRPLLKGARGFILRAFFVLGKVVSGNGNRIVFGTCFPARWSGFVRSVRNVARQINCHPEQVFDERSLFYRYAGDDFAVRGVAAVGVRFVDELGHADVVGVVVESRLEWNVDFVSAGDDFAHRVYP